MGADKPLKNERLAVQKIQHLTGSAKSKKIKIKNFSFLTTVAGFIVCVRANMPANLRHIHYAGDC